MNRNSLTSSLVLAAAFAFSSCGGAASGDNNNAGNLAQKRDDSVNTNVAANTTVAPASSATSVDNASPLATGATTNATSGSSNTSTGNKAQTANMPQPQIGSGGNDFYLFTQTRAAINADAELKNANIVIDVKEGIVTLSGKVGTAAQIEKAEQIARAVGGVKSVKNQLRVASAN